MCGEIGDKLIKIVFIASLTEDFSASVAFADKKSFGMALVNSITDATAVLKECLRKKSSLTFERVW